jgi:putative intracellular protease/amidase
MPGARRRWWRWLAAFGLAAVLAAVGGYVYLGMPTAEYQPYTYGRADRERLPRLTLLNHEAVMAQVLGTPPMVVKRIGILVYDGVDTLEALAPMAVFSELMGVQLEYLSVKPGVIRTRLAELVVERGIDEVTALDVLVVPGGNPEGIDAALAYPGLRDWLRRMDAGTQMTAAIGLGSVLLTDAGLLTGRGIAFGWPAPAENASALGARYVPGRYTKDGKYWTSVPATAALDLSLAMLGAIAGPAHLQAAMLDLEYAPAPPLVGGTPETTPEAIYRDLAAHTRDWRGLTLPAAAEKTDPPSAPLEVGLLVYPDFFTLDAIGPLAVLSELRHARVRLLHWGAQPRIKSGHTRLQVRDAASDAGKLDLLLVPGGANGTWSLLKDRAALDWIRSVDGQSRYTASVCTGSWVLGAAGLLQGRRATSNWYRLTQILPRWGAIPVAARHVRDGKYWTSAGVSAGIDLAFALIASIDGDDAARAAMLRLHYRPQPPLDAGTPETTDDRVLDMMHQMYDYAMVPLIRAEADTAR